VSIADQPVSSVEWIGTDKLSANDWNPNNVAPPERKLLAVSLLEDGWTQPIVVREEDGRLEIVDGYHRWTVAREDKRVSAMTDGMVPIVRVSPGDPVKARMATVRHNRARGTHYVLRMADLVAELAAEYGVPDDEMMRRLGMDDEEVSRLKDRGDMTRRGGTEDGSLSLGWRT